MQTAYRAESIIDAQIVKDALEDAGIPAFVAGAALVGGIGQLPARDFIRVLVPDPALVEARRIVTTLFPETASASGRDQAPVTAVRGLKPA